MLYVIWNDKKISVRRLIESWIIGYKDEESITDHHIKTVIGILNMCKQVRLYPELEDIAHLGFVRGSGYPIIPKSTNAIRNASLIIDLIFPGSIYIDKEKFMVYSVNNININEYVSEWKKLVNKDVDKELVKYDKNERILV